MRIAEIPTVETWSGRGEWGVGEEGGVVKSFFLAEIRRSRVGGGVSECAGMAEWISQLGRRWAAEARGGGGANARWVRIELHRVY